MPSWSFWMMGKASWCQRVVFFIGCLARSRQFGIGERSGRCWRLVDTLSLCQFARPPYFHGIHTQGKSYVVVT